jgi:hypothetical protein
MTNDIIQPEDYKYYVDKPDPTFSPRRNQAIIDETIKSSEKFFKELNGIMTDEMGNRIDILSTYARYRFNSGTKDVKSYLGDRLAKQLIGEKILSKVRVADTVNRLNGNDKFKNSILL